jgi:2,4-dienoyl-CoA reductase-like NADH-dependent reductase (Old Yellow Enzyme family)
MRRKLLTPLKVGEFDLRHRVILEWPLISGPLEVETIANMWPSDPQLSGGLVIFDPGPLDHVDSGSRLLNGLGSVDLAWRNAADGARLSRQYALARLHSGLSFPFVNPAAGINGLKQRDIDKIIDDYSKAAYRAKSSGFSGIELDGSYGTIIDLFLISSSNSREDCYGGPIIQRVSFLMELVEAVSRAFGRDRVGVRLSPFARKIVENVRRAVFGEVLRSLHDQEIAYVHIELTEGARLKALKSSPFAQTLRSTYPGIFITSGQQDIRSAMQLVESRWSDAACFVGPKVNAQFLSRLRGARLDQTDW